MADVLIPIANAAVSIGPLYAWRNVSGRCYSPPGSSWDMTFGVNAHFIPPGTNAIEIEP
jgi:hypothetical protein